MLVYLNESFFTLHCLVCPSHLNLCQCLTKIVPVDCIYNSKQEITINILFAVFIQFRQIEHYLFVGFGLLQNLINS